MDASNPISTTPTLNAGEPASNLTQARTENLCVRHGVKSKSSQRPTLCEPIRRYNTPFSKSPGDQALR